MVELAFCKYRVKTHTNTLVRKSSSTEGDYFSFKRHLASSTLLFASREHSLFHHVPHEMEYEWPTDGFYISPAIPTKDFLMVGKGMTTRVYNRIEFLGGVYNSAVFGSKHTSYWTTSTFSSSLSDILEDAVNAGYLGKEDLYEKDDEGEFKSRKSWDLIHKNPNKLMKKINKAIYQILYEKMTPKIRGKDMVELLEIAFPDLDLDNPDEYPSLLELETALENLPDERSNRKTSTYLRYKKSEAIFDDLMLYHYAWDSYRANIHPKTGEPTMMSTGSNDPVPTYGTMEMIEPGEEFVGYLVCRKDDIEKIKHRFRKIFHIGTLHNTNEVSLDLGKFKPVSFEKIEDTESIPIELLQGEDPEGFQLNEILESTDRYRVVQGKFTGTGLKLDNGCIPKHKLFDSYLSDKYEHKTKTIEVNP